MQAKQKPPFNLTATVFALASCVLWVGCGPIQSQGGAMGDPSSGASARPSGREPLGDLAVKIGMFVHKGFVLGVPSLHDLSISLYIPAEATPAQAVEIFRAALAAHNLTLTERSDYWLIEATPPSPAPEPKPDDAPLRQTNSGLLIDLDQVRLVEVTRTLSQLGGLRFAIAPELVEHRVTIQALRPVTPNEALDLLIATLTLDGIHIYRKGDLISISATPVAPADASTVSSAAPLDDSPVIPPRPRGNNPKATTANTPRLLPDTVP